MLTVYDELIAALRFCDGGECDGCCEYKKEHGCNTLLRDAADVIEEQSIVLESYRNRMRAGCDWIPVTEREPEFGENVLAVRRYGMQLELQEVVVAHIAVEKNGRTWWSAANITHWMPLPDPPKKEPDA